MKKTLRDAGFTLIELMLVLLILTLVLGEVFSQLSQSQQRLNAEETKLDDLQQARDFVDQFFRDINQIGTPNMQIMDITQTANFSPALQEQVAGCAVTPSSCTYSWANAYINDSRFAMGLVKIDSYSIQFEGSMNGDGTVQEVIYQVNSSSTCSQCFLQRSQVDKVNGDPLGGQSTPNWGTEVNDVIMTNPIFKYYQYDGTQITTLPVDYTTQAGAQTLANVKTIQINLTIRNNNILDKQTHLPIETSFEGEVSLNNCSMAASAQNMSCQ